MNEWNVVGSDLFPMGRIGARGDRLGLRVQTAKVAQHLMRIAFMVSRQYIPYKKWFGTLFMQLPVAGQLEPMLLDLYKEDQWRKVEEKICDIATVLIEKQNALGITPPINLGVKKSDDPRHHMDVDFWGIGRKLTTNLTPALKKVMDNQVFWLHEKSLILWNEEVGKWSMFLQK